MIRALITAIFLRNHNTQAGKQKAPKMALCFKNILGEMVGVTGIEPVTPSMSTKCYILQNYIQYIDFIILNRNLNIQNLTCVYTMSTPRRYLAKFDQRKNQLKIPENILFSGQSLDLLSCNCSLTTLKTSKQLPSAPVTTSNFALPQPRSRSA